MIRGSCHCGTITFSVPGEPAWLTACNCSICRRIAALWAYYPRREVEISSPAGGSIEYVHGDRTLAVHTCRRCGCTTHWLGLDPAPGARMAVNFRMCDPADMADIRVRHFDGAKTWEYLD